MDEQVQDAVSAGELRALMENRAALYGLLSRMYLREMDELSLQAMRRGRYPVSTGNEAMDEGYRLLSASLSNVQPGTVEELAQDFTHSFVGEGMDLFSAAYPYESVHTSSKRLLMQGPMDEVQAIMQSEGVQKRDDFNEPEDHIAIELEFMQQLVLRTAQALGDGDEREAARLLDVQRGFQADHLAAWTPLLTEQLRKFAQTDFYQALACLTDGFMAEELDFLAEVAR